jgi:hypothetical protein
MITNPEQQEKHQHTVHIKINGMEHKTHPGENSVEHLRQLGRVPEHETLSQEKAEGRLDLEEKGHLEIHGGEVFVSHKRHHDHPEVEVTINKSVHKTHRGKNSIEHLKHLGGVPKDEILSEFKDKEFIDFGTEGHVEIHGGEIFVGHRPGEPIVEVTNLNTNESVKFFAKWDETLQQVWTTAYAELKESPKPGDELLCDGGASLMTYLSCTLAQLREKKVCLHRKYQIRRATGGA